MELLTLCFACFVLAIPMVFVFYPFTVPIFGYIYKALVAISFICFYVQGLDVMAELQRVGCGTLVPTCQ
jgi:hypothetical protein